MRPQSHSRHARPEVLALWRRPLMTWLALMVLLAVNIGIAYVPAGDLTFSLNLAVAAAMVALIGWFFMDLSKASALNRMIAISGFLWVGILFLITFADYLTRP